jgi:hypothetical protein
VNVENRSADRLVVPLGKSKIALTVLGSAAFVAVGLWLLSTAAEEPRPRLFLTETIAIACIAFFGVCGLAALFKLFDFSPGLVIDAEGIVDNSSGISAGRIPWSDIRGFSVTTVQGQRFLTVKVDNPKKYVQRGHLLKRLFVNANASYFGGAIQISANALRIDFDELVTVTRTFHEKYRRK